jgi:uncharacterized protein YkwD
MKIMKSLYVALVLGLSLATVRAGSNEQKFVDELNLARTKPAEYAKFVEKHKKRFIDEMMYKMPSRGRIRTQEGKKAVDEAIEFLKKAKPVGKLKLSKGLSKAAEDHTKDIGKAGVTGHTGTDKSTMTDRMGRHGKWQKTCGENIAFGPDDAREVVMQLIIDDGVASRGHRVNIYKKDFKVVGISTGAHKKYGRMCTMDFAGGFKDKK